MRKLIAFFVFLSALSLSAENIVLDVPNFPPLAVIEGEKISGSFFDVAVKIFAAAGVSVKYRPTSTFAAAVNDLRNRRCDGFMPAVQTDERDEVATLTQPVQIQNWIWITLKSSDLKPSAPDFKSKARAGVLLQTAQETYLVDNKFTIRGTPTTLDALVKMLMADRVNVVLANELTWDSGVQEIGADPKLFTKSLAKTTKVGIYLSKAILATYPDLMNKINKAIGTVVK